MGFIIDIMRFMVESIFCYSSLNNVQVKRCLDKNYLLNNVKFSSIYVLILTGVDLIFTNTIFLRIISVMILFLYLSFESRDFKQYRFILTYSCGINILLEFLHFISVQLTFAFMYCLNMSSKSNYNIIWIYILFIYTLIIFCIYRLRIINTGVIMGLSRKNIVPEFLVCLLVCFVIIKYFYKEINSLKFCLIISNIIIIIIPLLFLIGFVIIKCIESKNKIQNNLDDGRIQNKIETVYIGEKWNCTSEIYKNDREIFSNKLNLIGINMGSKGYMQMILCLVIIKYHKGNKIVLSRDVYPQVARVTGDSAEQIEANIRNSLQRAWQNVDLEILSSEYPKPIDKDRGYPRPKDFLIYLAKNQET